MRAACRRGVLHVHRHTNISHKKSHGIAAHGVVPGGIRIVLGQHLVPLVHRLAEIHAHIAVVIEHFVRVAAPTSLRPSVISHDLSHGRGHASSVIVARETIVGVVLAPCRRKHRGNGLTVWGRSADNCPCGGLSLQLQKSVAIRTKQKLKLLARAQRVKCSGMRVAQHLPHAIVSSHNHEAPSPTVVIYIIRWSDTRSPRGAHCLAARRFTYIDILARNACRPVRCHYLA